MEPSLMDMSERNNTLYFTISNINVSYANAIRRVILSDIPTVVIRTFPYEKNDVNFEINTSNLNNEIIKQRLSCIPIHITDLNTELSDYIIEVDVKNSTDQLIYVTTADFKIKNLKTDKYLTDETVNKIFPPNKITEQYIDLCKLKPQYSENLKGEHLKFTAKLSIGNALENGSFNVVSTCSYSNTPNKYEIDKQREIKLTELQSKYSNDDDIKYHLNDWATLDAKRITIPNSFDFKIKSIGVFDNTDIVIKAIQIIINRLFTLSEIYSKPNNLINKSNVTIENSFDITLINEDYTIGKILEYSLYELYYLGTQTLTFCGFSKPHPHINESFIRIAFKEPVDNNTITTYIISAIEIAISYFKKILPNFGEIDPDELLTIKSSIPSTSMPSTSMPSTSMPSTSKPSTSMPSTSMPSTSMPSTSMPSTSMPSTSKPSTSMPSTSMPSTSKPSTSTAKETSKKPTISIKSKTKPKL